MARNVSELLPVRFEELTIDHVERMLADRQGEERETLFFERKSSITTASLAKACAAFANTMGGLLVVGVEDADDALVGIAPVAPEAQLWVKDTLRSRVLPMPPFRARWLAVDRTRGILLVLVEESTATPHLLTHSGAIYVRNPGSSDPCPISDQGRLLDLTRRGERAEQQAIVAALSAVTDPVVPQYFAGIDFVYEDPDEALSLAATGVSADFEARLFQQDTPTKSASVLWGEPAHPQAERRSERWEQDGVGIERIVERMRGLAVLTEAVMLDRKGAALLVRRVQERDHRSGDPRRSFALDELRARIAGDLRDARTLLSNIGAHGRLRLAYRLAPCRMATETNMVELRQATVVERWTTFEGEDVVDQVIAEILRVTGFGPAHLSRTPVP
jgi:hypothetical protein